MKFYTNIAVVGNTVLVREVVDGIPSMRRDEWSPALYLKGTPKDPLALSVKTLYGEDAYEFFPGSIRDCKEFVEQYKSVSNFEIFGQLDYTLQYCNAYKSVGWDYRQLSSWALDIETSIPVDANGKTYFPEPGTADGEILLITMVDMHTGRAFTFGSRPYTGEDTHYTVCANETQLLKLFLEFWSQRKVDIITGWNINGFDLPYIINRAIRVLGDEPVKRLSPWNRVSCKEREFNGKIEFRIDILGVSVLDYIDLYKKYIFVKQESYSLGHIAQAELGHSKVDHSEFGSFTDFYTKAWDKFVFYNIKDTTLIKDLDDKLKLLELVLTVAYEANINYEQVSSPVKTWDAIISNYCLKHGIVLPQQRREPSHSLDGAYVKEPVPGWYHNVVSLDATSLYPSIIMTNNISPETYLGKIDMDIETFLEMKPHTIDADKIITPVGAIYDRSKRGLVPTLIEHFMQMRREAKNEMLRLEQELENGSVSKSLESKISALDNKQMAIKILMNSLYGALANEHFRFYKYEHAASITLTGQFALRSIEKHIDAELNDLFKTEGAKYLIYGDTDSLYFTLDAVFKKYSITEANAIKTLEKLAQEKMSPTVNKICQICCDYMHSYENRLVFKTEIAADKGIFCCLPDTEINVGGDLISIEQYYNLLETEDRSDLTASFNSATKELELDEIYGVYKKHYSGKVYTFCAENGKRVSVTEDHVMFVERNGEVMEVFAKDVLESDSLFHFAF